MSKILLAVWNMIKKYKKTSILLVLLVAWWLYGFCYNRSFPKDTGDFVPYVLGSTVDFSEKGNSSLFVNEADGWGNQEPLYRCTVKQDVYVKFYVKNDEQAIQFNIFASGSFPYPDKQQRIIVSVNGKPFSHWDVSADDWYSVIIPASMIENNKLEIKFTTTKPYTPKGDTRQLGMIVKKMKIKKIYGHETRVKLRTWFYKLLDKYLSETEEEKKARQEERKKWTTGESEF